MNEPVHHCAAGCGRYGTMATVRKDGWHVTLSADSDRLFTCSRCRRAALQARVRSALVNGVRLGTKDLSPDEREAAAQVLGPELLETVDGGWGGDKHETPPYGVPMDNWPAAPAGLLHGGVPLTVDDLHDAEKRLGEIPKFDPLQPFFADISAEWRRIISSLVVQSAPDYRRPRADVDDPLFAELSSLYNACLVRAPQVNIVSRESMLGGWCICVYARVDGLVSSCLSLTNFSRQPTWADIKEPLERALRRLMGSIVEEC